MCVIIKVKPKVTLSRQLLENCYDNNPDGYGMMVAEKDGLYFHKDVKSFTDFWNVWKTFDRERPRAIHFRRKTHGKINQANCHPFFPSKELGFMHNGIINVPEVYKDMNDTFNFMMQKIKPFVDQYPDIIEDDNFYKLLEEITGGSRLLFLTKNGKFHITKADQWHTQYGCQFSNKYSLEKWYRRSVTTSYPAHGYNASNANAKVEDKETKNVDKEVATTPFTNKEIQRAIDESMDIGSSHLPLNLWGGGEDYSHAHSFGSGSVNGHETGEVCPVPPYTRIMDDRRPYGHEAEDDDLEDQIKEAFRKVEEEAYLEDMQATHTGSTATNLPVVIQGSAVVIHTDDEEATDTIVGNFQANAAQAAEPLYEAEVVEEEEESDADPNIEIFYMPNELKAMTEEQIVEWCEEYPVGAATAIMILTGRV